MLIGTYRESGNVKRKSIRVKDYFGKNSPMTYIFSLSSVQPEPSIVVGCFKQNWCMKNIELNITFMTLQGEIANIIGILEYKKIK